MNIATGAMSTLLPKLAKLVMDEYNLQTSVKRNIEKLQKEMTSMNAALHKVAEVPPDQLDVQDKIWAGDVRELSYDIEDQVDIFMLGDRQHETQPFSLERLVVKATSLYKKARTNHKIHNAIRDIMGRVEEVAERRDRYRTDNMPAKTDIVSVDPRLEGMYRMATELVDIDGPKKELAIRLLQQDFSSSSRHLSNIISIVGFGGLGKTTLANSLLQDHKAQFECHVFVPVSLNPDIKKILKNILLQLDEEKYSHLDEGLEIKQLIDKIKEFLKSKKWLCVIDDLWEELAWDTIKLPFQDGKPGSKIIITTRSKKVAELVEGGIYDLKPLSDFGSRKLFNMRIFGTDGGCPSNLREVSGKILKKCGGVPLAIITIASLLDCIPQCSVEWEKVNESIGSGLENSLDVGKMRKILSLSYYDLPSHLKTCLLSLSKYPEDHKIRKDVLIWSWIAEGFITTEERQPAAETSLYEIGEKYFSDLISRSLIQPVEEPLISKRDGQVHCCQVHDMVHELINHLSAEEAFVTNTLFLDSQQVGTSNKRSMQQQKIRRLSLHNSNKSYVSPEAREKQNLSKVRSLDVFGKVESIPPLSSFHVLRVLQVDDCSGLDNNHLNDLRKLRLLRFLRLKDLKGTKLPESIGELESLETLDIRGPILIRLPLSFGKLGKLVRLIASRVKLPDGVNLENMKSLQELVGIMPTSHAVTEIGKLTQLKVLGFSIFLFAKFSTQTELILKYLHMDPSIEVLFIQVPSRDSPLDFMEQVPCGLQRFVSHGKFMWTFPKWINPSLSRLTAVTIGLEFVEVLPEHLETLAGLPSLRFLGLYALNSRNQNLLMCPSGASAFQCLTELQFECYLMFLKFQHGAMPRLQKLQLSFNAWSTDNKFATNFDYGLENLPSLRYVAVQLIREVCFQAEHAIVEALRRHPNHPSLQISAVGI